MNDTLDPAAAGNGGTFDAQQAAQILGQTSQRARRQFEQFPPWFSAARGIAALLAYGAVWLNVRGQHPYAHPTAAVIPVGIVFGIVCAILAIVLARRASTGVTGKTPLRPVEIAIVLVISTGQRVRGPWPARRPWRERFDRLRRVPSRGAVDGRGPGLGWHHGDAGQLAGGRGGARARRGRGGGRGHRTGLGLAGCRCGPGRRAPRPVRHRGPEPARMRVNNG